MPLTGLKLFGSTVKDFTTGLGWGNQKSNVKVSLVQDTLLGDYFLPPPIGALSHVTFEALNFWGILQKWTQVASAISNGFPTYEVIIEDPRAILEGTEVIFSAYTGSTYNVPNLLNAYGYLENQLGFGGSQKNDSGIPWHLVRTAVTDLTNLATSGTYGGPLSYKGYYYILDLSDMPTPPEFYRVGSSVGFSLMTLIEQVCNDSGCDFFVDLIPNSTIIRVRTVSRRLQPPTGYIQALVDEQISSGTLINSEVGLEAINQPTSVFIVGGPVQVMYEAPLEAIHPYFGKDVDGNPILSINTQIGNAYSLTTILNSSEVKDIINSNSYQCTALEMACALTNFNTWADFVFIQKPVFAAAIGLLAPDIAPLLNGVVVPKMPQDAINLTPAMVLAASGANVDGIQHWINQRMFNFVQKAAAEYLGKRFLVEIPFMFTATEPETGRIIHSYEVTQGGYVESGLPPLGLHPIYKNVFSFQDGTFGSYGLYANLVGTNADLSLVGSTEFVIDIYSDNGIYVKISVDSEIIFLDELTPCVSITVSNPLYQKPIDATGAGINLVAAVVAMTAAQAADIFKKLAAGNMFAKINPLPLQLDTVAIPLKSNILTYGPWFGVGAQGKVLFQQDTTLVPWNYGGSDDMSITANAKIVEAITFQQATESGSVELVGAPVFNIGDQLQLTGQVLRGPTITGIEVKYGEKGVTSNYRMQTFTSKFGAFSKDNIERLKRINLHAQELRREASEAFARLLRPDLNNEVISILNGGAGNLGAWPPQFQRKSPHSMFMAIIDEDGDYPGLARVSATTVSDREIAPSIPANDLTLYDKSAAMSITGLIRPISTSYTSNWLACYEEPNANYTANAKATFLDPFKGGNDIELYTYGTTYVDAHAYLNGGPTTDGVRGFALRGPLVISGWGMSNDNIFEPAGVGDYLRESWFWKTGPVDLLWDNERKVWTPHGTMMGVTVGACTPGGFTTVKLHDSAGEIAGRAVDRTVYNFFSQEVAADKKIIAAWVPEAERWYIIAADCV